MSYAYDSSFTNYESLSPKIKKQITCLANNVYFEASGESYQGKTAIAFVTINRVQTGNYAKDVCGVVYQKTKGVCQFSWYCNGNRLTIRDRMLYNEILKLSTYIYLNYNRLDDVTNGATYFHSVKINPRWKHQRVARIGNHIFYRSRMDRIDRSKPIYMAAII